MALTESPCGKPGSIAPAFELLGVDGRTYGLEDFAESLGLVVVFMCNHCPYVVATQGRINALAQKYRKRGISLVGISSNDAIEYPEDSYSAMQVRAREEGYEFPYLYDGTQNVARAYGAVCTPDFFAYKRADLATEMGAGTRFLLRYRGRLDDNWKDSHKVKSQDLANALDALLAHRPVEAKQFPAVGCSIKWKNGRGD